MMINDNRFAIHKLSNALEMIKGFSTGHTTRNSKAMIVNIEGENYRLTIEKIDGDEISFDTIGKYL